MKYLVLPAFAALLFTGIAMAAEPAANVPSSTPPSSDPALSFQQLDKNHDGVISKSEAKHDPRLAKDFKECDTNHDGKIDKNELKACALFQAAPRSAPMSRY